jgi:hypothetical protein
MVPLNFLETRHERVGLSTSVKEFQLGNGGPQYGERRENDGTLERRV